MEQQSYLSELEFNPVLAGAGQRFLNYLIDVIIFYLLFTVIAVALVASGYSNLGTSSGYDVFTFLSQLFYMALFACYYFLSELAFKGRTIGKFITGTKAVNEDGTAMEPKTIMLRSLSRIVPFEPFSAFGGHPWHDKWTRTYVIDVKKTTFSEASAIN